MKKENLNGPRRLSWKLHAAFEWGRAFWPVVLAVAAGATVFRGAVIESIASTPHPALVYAIFSVAGCAVLLCAAALLRYVREEALTQRLLHTPQQDRAALVSGLRWQPDMLPVLRIMTDDATFRPEAKATAIEHELFACEERLFAHLILPNYLTGALVGLGLVGTFIGLLGTLADLGDLFSSLMNAGGASSSADPVAMFTDMLRKLQEPMRGMGTAFVASLYGLLGSLVLGLVTYSVRKSGTKVVAGVRALIREADQGEGARPVPAGSTPEMLQFLIEELRAQHSTVAQALSDMALRQDQQVACLEGMMALAQAHRQDMGRLPETLARLAVAVDGIRGEIAGQGEHSHAQLQLVASKLDALGRRTWPSLGQAVAQGAAIGTAIAAASILMVTIAIATYRRMENTPQEPVAAVAAQEAARPSSEPEHAKEIVPAIASSPEGTTEASSPISPEEPAEASSPISPVTVKVKRGDYLNKIAKRYGTTTEEIVRANPQLKNINILLPGQVLQLPPKRKE